MEFYCRNIEDLFMTEMFPRPPPETPQSQKDVWLNKAKQLTISGEKKVEPFNFTAGVSDFIFALRDPDTEKYCSNA